MSNICLVIFIGIPGVGKTDLCKYVKANLKLANTQVSHISFDEYEQRSEPSILYKIFRKNVYKDVENLLIELLDQSKENCNINKQYYLLIDDNMYYRSMRRCYYNLAKDHTIGFCQIYVNCDIQQALHRNSSRNNKVPEKIIYEMADKIEPPLDTNFWERFSCRIDSEKPFTPETIDKIKNTVDNAIKNPIKSTEQLRNDNKNHESFMHSVDLILRKLVSRYLKDAIVSNTNKKNLEILSKELMNKKKIIVNGLKNNELFFPETGGDLFVLENFLQNLIENINL